VTLNNAPCLIHRSYSTFPAIPAQHLLAWSPISVRHRIGHIEPKNVRFELRSYPNLVFLHGKFVIFRIRLRMYCNICNLNGFWDFYHHTNVAAGSSKADMTSCVPSPCNRLFQSVNWCSLPLIYITIELAESKLEQADEHLYS
jgi:hypothetical protein